MKEKRLKKYFVYRHVRHDTNMPFYIGKGTTELRGISEECVYYRAFSRRIRNRIWKFIVAKTSFDVDIIYVCDSPEIALEKEKEFIAMYGRIDKGTGTLCNLTDGGDGVKVHEEAFYESVKTRLKKGVYKKIGDLNARPVCVYDLNGKYIKTIRSKRDFANEVNCDTSIIFTAIKNKTELAGYFLANDFYETLDISEYRRKKTYRNRIYKKNSQGEVLEVFNSLANAARSVGGSESGLSGAISQGRMFAGFCWEKKVYNIFKQIA